MLQYFQLFLVVFAAFFVIDLIWLGVIGKNFYRTHLGFIMRKKVFWPPAIIFYLLYIVGLIFFVINPALGRESWLYALMAGAFFGLICYSTYDLSNLATLDRWPLPVTIADIVWGTTLSGLLSLIGFLYGSVIF